MGAGNGGGYWRVIFVQQQRAIMERRAQDDTLASLNVPLSIVCGVVTLDAAVLSRKWPIWHRMLIFVC